MKLCWWCSHDVGNTQIGVPTERTLKHKRVAPRFMMDIAPPLPVSENIDIYELEGQFCSFECARAYIIAQKDYKYENQLQRLSHMRKHAFLKKGVEFKKIPPFKSAPSWKTLKQYGGTLDIEEFRSDTTEWVIDQPGYLHNAPTVSKRRQRIVEKSSWKDKKELIEKASNPTEQLKIKRSKPRAPTTGFGDIGSSLGIKVVVKD